ncbi:serine/threonine protein kinase [Virgibacillus oceani]|uniref:Serine/threonine-protein kinase YbdM n=1 Tax=Virgibacillus oceani TaxID=1479511 RepID=A0A917HCQ0_9BACI|nr:protein kinase family protein [Virgibacillus oceani]GGG75441.1 putative serine/threonine-protein kinase YbdM [Virgibacillus oceani]
MNPVLRPIRKVYQFFADSPFGAGTIIAHRFKVNHLLGRGSFGIAYNCIDLNTSKHYVLKQLRPSKRNNEKDIELFYNEASILRKLNHMAIPNAHGQFTYKGNYFYIMDFIEGYNAEDILFEKRCQFDEMKSLLLFRKLVEIVDYLHNQRICHGDLRIPNVILQGNALFLIDFGLAIDLDSNTGFRQTKQGRMETGKELMKQDYFDLGDLLLFLLYSSYPKKSKKALPWTEELSLHPLTAQMLRRLLGIDREYLDTKQILSDIDGILMEKTYET